MATQIEKAAYQRGVKTGSEMESVTIALNGVWGGRSKDGGSVQSYERIGYHAGAMAFIRGVMDAGCPVFRFENTSGLASNGSIRELPVLFFSEIEKIYRS